MHHFVVYASDQRSSDLGQVSTSQCAFQYTWAEHLPICLVARVNDLWSESIAAAGLS